MAETENEIGFVIHREHDCRIAFGISDNEVDLLPDYRYPTKGQIKLIADFCVSYLMMKDEDIEAENERLRIKFEEDNK
jgi:hypothetical protein